MERSRAPFELIKEHVLLPPASMLKEADAALSSLVTPDVVNDILSLIPDSWMAADSLFKNADDTRRAYAEYLLRRLDAPRLFAEEAERARASLI
jgi:hypothetical protein